MFMALKLTSCDLFGMLLQYWLSTEGGFVGGEKVNLVGVLVSGGLLCLLASVAVSGGNMTCCCKEVVLCEACCCDVYWLCCCMGCCWEFWTVFYDAAAVSADVFGLVVAAAAVVLAGVTILNAVLLLHWLLWR